MPQPAWGSIAQDPRKSTCLDLLRVLVTGRLLCLKLLRDLPVRGIPGGQPALTCLGIWSSKSCHASTCSGIHHSRGPRRSTCLDLPRDPVLGRPACLDLPRDLISRRLSYLSLPGDLHPDLGMPGSQVATGLGRISFRKSHP